MIDCVQVFIALSAHGCPSSAMLVGIVTSQVSGLRWVCVLLGSTVLKAPRVLMQHHVLLVIIAPEAQLFPCPARQAH